eukprot:4791667-Pyramimonas_sp.AAC.1
MQGLLKIADLRYAALQVSRRTAPGADRFRLRHWGHVSKRALAVTEYRKHIYIYMCVCVRRLGPGLGYSEAGARFFSLN